MPDMMTRVAVNNQYLHPLSTVALKIMHDTYTTNGSCLGNAPLRNVAWIAFILYTAECMQARENDFTSSSIPNPPSG